MRLSCVVFRGRSPPARVGLAACATTLTGPAVMVLAGGSKHFEQFRVADGACRQSVHGWVGGMTSSRAAEVSGLCSGAPGTSAPPQAWRSTGARARQPARASACWWAGWRAPRPCSAPRTKPSAATTSPTSSACMRNGPKAPAARRFASSSPGQHSPCYPPPPRGSRPPPRRDLRRRHDRAVSRGRFTGLSRWPAEIHTLIIA